MSFQMLEDFANNAANEIGKFKLDFVLSPDKILEEDLGIDRLNWQNVKYGPDEADEVPNDKRGIYAFIVRTESSILPLHGYVMYIGIAGKKSERSLRERYQDYLNPRKVQKRGGKIARMIGTWHQVLSFYFAPVDEAVSSDQLENIERKLNTALLPPFSEGDLEGYVKSPRRAYRT